jgi:large subunit ribosomal protein L20
MPRARGGFKTRRRKKRLFAKTKGFRGTRKNHISTAIHVLQKSLQYAYRDRRNKKRTFRNLWIIRINAAARAAGLKYSELIHGLKKLNAGIDRTVLANLALTDVPAFNAIVEKAKAALTK